MKKRILFFIFLFITLFFVNIDVYADNFGEESLQVTCIYADGKSITKSYDTFNKSLYANLNDYPVANRYKLNNNINEYRIYAGTINGVIDKNNSEEAANLKYSCPNQVYRYLVEEYSEDDDTRYMNVVYSFSIDRENSILVDPRNGWQQFWGTQKKKLARLFDQNNLTTSCDANGSGTCGSYNYALSIPLVAERITWAKGADDLKTCNYVHQSSQASGSDQYIELMYTSTGNLYLSRDDDITSVDNHDLRYAVNSGKCESSSYKCICVKHSTKEQNSAEGTSEYIFSSRRHEVSLESVSGESCSCPEGYVSYEYTATGDPNSGSGSNAVQVCTAMPETTKVLARIIKWVQILVPIFVIVFTGIDIGKIVVAGNLEEELPKRKKGIIVRFIVMLVFLFLPLIIKVLFSTIFDEGTLGVADIDCLFEVDLVD